MKRRVVRCGMVALGFWLAISAGGCTNTSSLQNYRPRNPDEALVVATLLKIPTGIHDKNLDLVMQPYADDVYIGNFYKYLGVAGPSASLTITKVELRIAYAQLFRAVKEVSMDVIDFRVTVQGDRAVAEARTELLPMVESGRKEHQPDVIRNDILWRLKRTPNGWKIQEEIYQ